MALSLLADWKCLGAEELDRGARLRAFFAEDTDLDPVEAELRRELPGVDCRVLPPVPLKDWLAEWKQSFTGFALGESFFVLPTWKPVPEGNRSILRIDPEQAFGTGTHDTTRLAAALLERAVTKTSSVIDVGSGTGILAMVAARLGAPSVRAIEPDPEAVRCARENLARNGLAERVSVEQASVEDFETFRADIVIANILRPVLLEALPRLDSPTVILSGLLAEEVSEFLASVPKPFRVETWTSGDWAALLLTKKEPSPKKVP